MDPANGMSIDRVAFREVVRHPQMHALVLENYRLGEHAGVLALDRLLGEMRPEGRLHQAMMIHHRDEERHSSVFTDWIARIGVTPVPFPADAEAFFVGSAGDLAERRAVVAELPPALHRIVVFAGINAIERLAYDQFDVHLACLDRREDRELLQGVMDEEKFHLSYVERELEREGAGQHSAFVAHAVEEAQARIATFQQNRRAQTAAALQRVLGGRA